jgi:phage-related protein
MAEDIILSSPFFNIDPSESYVIGCNLGKSSSESRTTNTSAVRPLYTGVGVRLTFYDSNQNIISPTGKSDEVFNHHPADNHIITSSDSIPIIDNTGVEGVNIVTSGRSLKKIIDHSDIPSSGGLAKLEAVAYNHFKGNFYWTNMFAKTVGDYYFTSSDNTGDVNPVESSEWTLDFNHVPSYGSSVSFDCELDQMDMANGYLEVKPKNLNHISSLFELQFNNRSDRENKSIIQFLENHAGSKKFNFTPPAPYDKKIEVVCEQFSTSREYTNSNNINATFLVDNIDSLNWKDPISTYTGEWSAAEDYKKNDYIQYSPSQRKSHDTYFYATEDSTNVRPDLQTKWSNDYFSWLPSHQQALSLSPRINKVELENKYAQRSEDGINANTLKFNSTHNDREDKEAAAISHFLYHKMGYQPFDALLPNSFSNRNLPEITGELISSTGIQISGEQTSTVELSQALSVPLEVGGLEVDQEIIFDSVQSTHNKVYLTSGALNGDGQIHVRSMNYADIPSGSSFKIFPAKSRFYCPNWTHTWTFKDNNSISADFVEFPFMKSKPVGTSGFYISPTSIDYSTQSIYSTIDKKVRIYNTGITSLTVENMSVLSDGEFYLTSDDDGYGHKYKADKIPFEIAGLSSKQIYIRCKPTGLIPPAITGSGIFTIEGQQSGILLTGNADSNFIVTGAELESEAHDIQPSGLTQIILTKTFEDGQDTKPIDYLVWKH